MSNNLQKIFGVDINFSMYAVYINILVFFLIGFLRVSPELIKLVYRREILGTNILLVKPTPDFFDSWTATY